MKKALFLGGAYAQIPILKAAKARGWYVITCDYLPENPGHKFADEYYNISTTDKEKVLALATQLQPDYVIAYASDPAAPVAAYVSEKLGLPGNSYASVEMLSEKDKFRSFLAEHNFNVPKHLSIQDAVIDFERLKQFQFPVIVKPTDSSGSKGVTKVENVADITSAVDYALQFSRNKRIIVEEFISTNFKQLHGDAFVQDAELVFCYLGEHFYNEKINPFVPYSTTWPANIDDSIMEQVKLELAKVLEVSGFKEGAINVEVRVTEHNKIYIMEIGPRSGGNFVPQITECSTGFDMVNAILDVYEKKEIYISDLMEIPSAYYVVHSGTSGILESLSIHEKVKPFVKEFHQYVQVGQKVTSFQGSNAAIGVALLTFPSKDVMYDSLKNMHEFVEIGLRVEP